MAPRNKPEILRDQTRSLNLNYSPSAKMETCWFLPLDPLPRTNSKLFPADVFEVLKTNNQELLTSPIRLKMILALLKYAVTYTPKEETYVKYSILWKGGGTLDE